MLRVERQSGYGARLLVSGVRLSRRVPASAAAPAHPHSPAAAPFAPAHRWFRRVFGEQHRCADEKTSAALAGAISMTTDARAIHRSTHFQFTSKSQH